MSNPRGLSLQKSLTTQSGNDIKAALRGTLYDLQAQTNTRTQQRGIRKKRPTGTKFGDTTTRITEDGGIATAFYDSKGNFIERVTASDANSNLAFKTGSVPPAIADYPTPGENGQFYDTAAQALYIVRNYNGALIYPNFLSISGTITNDQHGARGRVTTTGSLALHTNATTSEAGFMSATDKTKLDNAVSTATASRLVIRDASAGAAFAALTATGITASTLDASGNINTATFYEVDGVQVVKERQAAIAGATGTLANAVTTINLVIGALRQHGLIATLYMLAFIIQT